MHNKQQKLPSINQQASQSQQHLSFENSWLPKSLKEQVNANTTSFARKKKSQKTINTTDLSYLDTYHPEQSAIHKDLNYYKQKFLQISDNVYHQMEQASIQLSLPQEFELNPNEISKKNSQAQGSLSTHQIQFHSLFQDETAKHEKFNQYLERNIAFEKTKLIQKKHNADKVPPNRKETLDLIDWLNHMMDTIKNQKGQFSMKQLAEYIQLIYSTCLKDVIRQVQIQCNERGVLLQKIWDYYVELLEQILNSYYEQNRYKEQEYLDQVKRVHASYNDLIDKQKNYIIGVKQENTDLIEDKNKLNDNNAYLRNRLEKTNAELRLVNNLVDDLKKENYILNNKVKKKGEKHSQSDKQDSDEAPQGRSFFSKINAYLTDKVIPESIHELEEKEAEKKKYENPEYLGVQHCKFMFKFIFIRIHLN